MLIDCETCPAPRRHCAECMVTTLLETPAPHSTSGDSSGTGHEEPLDREERRAVDLFAGLGMIAAREALRARAWCEPAGVRARFVG